MSTINIIAGSISFFAQGIQKGQAQPAPDLEFGGTLESFASDVNLLNKFCANVLEPAMVTGDTQFSRRLPKESKLVADLKAGESADSLVSVKLNDLIDALKAQGVYSTALDEAAVESDKAEETTAMATNMEADAAVETKLAGVLTSSQRPAHVTFENKMPKPDAVIVRLTKGELYYTEDETEHFLVVKGKNVNIDGTIIATDIAWPHVKNFVEGALKAHYAGVEINLATALVIDTVTTFVNSADELDTSVLSIRAADVAALHSIKYLQDSVDFAEVSKFDNAIFRQQLMSIVSYNMGGVSVRAASDELPVHAFGVVEFELSKKNHLAYVFQGGTCMLAYTQGKKVSYSDVTTLEGLRSCAMLEANGEVANITEDRSNQYRLLGHAEEGQLMIALGDSGEWEVKPTTFDGAVAAWNAVSRKLLGHVTNQADMVRIMLSETVEILETAAGAQLEALEGSANEYLVEMEAADEPEEEQEETEVEEEVETTKSKKAKLSLVPSKADEKEEQEEETEVEEEEEESSPEEIDYLDMKPANLRKLVVDRGILSEDDAKTTPPADLVDMLTEYDEQMEADVQLGEAIENRLVEKDRSELKKLIGMFNQSEVAQEADLEAIKVLKNDSDESLIKKLLDAFDEIDDLREVCDVFGWEDLYELDNVETEDEDDDGDDWEEEE